MNSLKYIGVLPYRWPQVCWLSWPKQAATHGIVLVTLGVAAAFSADAQAQVNVPVCGSTTLSPAQPVQNQPETITISGQNVQSRINVMGLYQVTLLGDQLLDCVSAADVSGNLNAKSMQYTFGAAGTYNLKVFGYYSSVLFNACTATTPICGSQLSLTVASPPAPTVSFSASPTTINVGNPSTLTWSSTNATSCTGTGGWNQNLATSGSMAVTPPVTTTYNITCTGSGGTSPVKSVKVTVVPKVAWLVPVLAGLLR